LVFNFNFGQEKFDGVVSKKFQEELNEEYANPKKSPLTKEDLATFKSLDFYPISEKYFIVAKFVSTEGEKPFMMQTTTDRKPLYVKYGEAHFELEGKNFKLNLYRNVDVSTKKDDDDKDYLFLPFSDLTSGEETYIGGRYMDFKIPKGETIVIDFNKSYNPYCAYNHKYSCPKVPFENDMQIEIKAGVKKFHD
jgi:uncharacterized protein (DUF1684 family)